MMSSWWHLLKKEVRLGIPALLFTIIAWVVVNGTAFYFGSKYGQGLQAMAMTSLFLIGVHVMYLLCYMLFSLQRERKKLHLWLHNPLPGYALLLAKLVSGLFSMTITLFISCVVVLAGWSKLQQFPNFPVTGSQFFSMGIFSIIHIYLLSVDFTIWFILFWMVFRMFYRSLGGFMSFIATLIFAGILIYIYGKFSNSVVYSHLTNWGALPISSSLQGFFVTMGVNTMTFHLYLGYYVIETLTALILFVISCWILDRKVEV